MKLKAIRSKNPQDSGEFKQLRNKVNIDIRILKESYYKQSFTENKIDSRRTWQTINELTSRKSNTPSIKELIVNGVSINKSTDLANAFNKFMLIGSRQKLNTLTASPVLNINGTPLNQVSSSKSLGVLIDANLQGAVISKGWLKKLPLVLQLSKELDNLFPQQHSILSTKP